MARRPGERTVYGPNKYVALNLLLARWIRVFPTAPKYHYVTLGGTELRDVNTLNFIDRGLVSPCSSFETNAARYKMALDAVDSLTKCGVAVQMTMGDLFDFKRTSEIPHLFFFDFEGACTSADYPDRFAQMLRDSTIREGDAVLITSYLGRNPGWTRLFRTFESEFIILGANDAEAKRFWYRRAHPSFTVYKGLSHANLQDELNLKCIGCVEYRDSSTMGLYGYVVSSGNTAFAPFIQEAPYFNTMSGEYFRGLG